MDEPKTPKFDSAKEDAQLTEMREREEEDVIQILSTKYDLPYVDMSFTDVDGDALRVIPEADARAAEAVAYAHVAHSLSVAIHNPNNPKLPKLRQDLTDRGYTLKEALVSKKSLDGALARYSDLSLTTQSKKGVFLVAPATLEKLKQNGGGLSVLAKAIEEAVAAKSLDHITYVFELVLAGAFVLRSSDIHFEPEEEKTRLRLRIDGMLTDIFYFDAKTYHQINSRLKLLSGMKLNVTNRAQDGRFSIERGEEQIEMRVSFIPGNYGEAVVMRILDPKATQVSYKELGINDKLLARLETEIRKPNGMLLTTGPTGSGKTTTLYSFLRGIHTPDIKIITIEDPIEYHLEGIVQTQVEGKKYTFAEGLRSIVRQDPDVVMVGEIRDGETAGIAMQASLTGHFVFSTIHTNDAAGTFPRLADLGIDPKSFGSAITVAMAQRLVRRLHPDMKKERPLTDDEKARIARLFEPLADKSLIPEKIETVWEAVPKNEDETGFKGRIGLYEAIFMDDELANFLRDNPPSNEINKMAAKQGYLTMAQDGVIKALEGVTTLDEVSSTVNFPA